MAGHLKPDAMIFDRRLLAGRTHPTVTDVPVVILPLEPLEQEPPHAVGDVDLLRLALVLTSS